MIYRKPQPPAPLFVQDAPLPGSKMPGVLNGLREMKAAELRDDGIERAASRVSPEWWRAARRAIEHAARMKPEGFTVDDVQDALATLSVDPPTEGRAMGAAMTAAKADGLIVATERFETGRQPKSHANPRRAWKAVPHG